MYRRAIEDFKEWKDKRTALLVTGARQIGKTYIIRKFLQEYCNNDYIEINFFENKEASKIFTNFSNASDLLLRISAFTNKNLNKGKTIIFLDEVQECPNIITAIKFLVENGNFKYILSGSLLGTELKDIKSVPVGYMDILEMHPMDFEEFLIANKVNNQIILSLKNSFDTLTPVDEVVHNKIIEAFHLYLIIGGMPNVVKTYIETNNLKKVIDAQQSINQQYKMDIAKYDYKKKLYINEIFDLIPSELNNQNKRFIMKDLNQNLKFSRYENSFLWLKNAGVAIPVYCVDEPTTPLMLSKSRNLFKLFHCDVGLLSAMYMDNNLQIKLLNKEKNINYGAIYENAVAQELTAKGFNAYYYKSNTLGEIDFLIEKEGEVVPIEVKSGKDYKKHNALNNLLSKFKIKTAYVLSNNNIEVVENKIYLPIYMIMFFERPKMKDTIYKLDLQDLKI